MRREQPAQLLDIPVAAEAGVFPGDRATVRSEAEPARPCASNALAPNAAAA